MSKCRSLIAWSVGHDRFEYVVETDEVIRLNEVPTFPKEVPRKGDPLLALECTLIWLTPRNDGDRFSETATTNFAGIAAIQQHNDIDRAPVCRPIAYILDDPPQDL